MKKFIPKEKQGKKARKQLDSERRTTWAFSPGDAEGGEQKAL